MPTPSGGAVGRVVAVGSAVRSEEQVVVVMARSSGWPDPPTFPDAISEESKREGPRKPCRVYW
jgi:hypothetical protein